MSYRTVEREESEEFVERKSRFLGHIKHVETQEEAIRFIEEKKSRYWDASHNVYAYSLRDQNIKRYSDDGEPQGTAGVPVLEVLNKEGLVDVVVVVTRYFGGTLLGAGGLVRAYSKGAKLAVDAGSVITMRECDVCKLTCNYTLLGKLQNEIAAYEGHITASEYTDQVTLEFYLPMEQTEALRQSILELSAGTLSLGQPGRTYKKEISK